MKLNMVEAINLALKQEMKKDKDVLVLGEDVGIDGGVFRVTEGLLKLYGEKRVIDTPLSESGIIGISIGMAVYGLKNVDYAKTMGSIKHLLISNSTLKKGKIEKNKALDELLSDIKGMKGDITIVSNEHDLGKQLEGLGGLAATLRFRIEITE